MKADKPPERGWTLLIVLVTVTVVLFAKAGTPAAAAGLGVFVPLVFLEAAHKGRRLAAVIIKISSFMLPRGQRTSWRAEYLRLVELPDQVGAPISFSLDVALALARQAAAYWFPPDRTLFRDYRITGSWRRTCALAGLMFLCIAAPFFVIFTCFVPGAVSSARDVTVLALLAAVGALPGAGIYGLGLASYQLAAPPVETRRIIIVIIGVTLEFAAMSGIIALWLVSADTSSLKLAIISAAILSPVNAVCKGVIWANCEAAWQPRSVIIETSFTCGVAGVTVSLGGVGLDIAINFAVSAAVGLMVSLPVVVALGRVIDWLAPRDINRVILDSNRMPHQRLPAWVAQHPCWEPTYYLATRQFWSTHGDLRDPAHDCNHGCAELDAAVSAVSRLPQDNMASLRTARAATVSGRWSSPRLAVRVYEHFSGSTDDRVARLARTYLDALLNRHNRGL